MRADRLLSILLLLQAHRRLTAGELARRLEVSPRTIYRDMDALSAAGIPVVAERGAHGGWALLDDYRTSLTGLTAVESQTLFLSTHVRLFADLGIEREAAAARLKLLAALPEMARRNAEHARQRLYVDVAGWGRRDEALPCLSLLQSAVWEERQIALSYRRNDGEQVERVVEPLGLVAKGSIWYLVAAVEGEPRTYRVSRIVDARIRDAPCRRPDGFDLEAYWQQSAAEFRSALPRYPVTLRVAPEALGLLRAWLSFARIEHETAPDADGWVPLVIDVQAEHEALALVFRFGPCVEVVEPADLRAKVIEMAGRVAKLHRTT